MKNQNNINLEEVKIPWQGRVLSVVVFLFLVGLMIWFTGYFFVVLMIGETMMLGDVFNLFLLLVFTDTVIGLILFFIYKGLTKGLKWSLAVIFILSLAWLLFPVWVLVDVNDLDINLLVLSLIIISMPLVLLSLRRWRESFTIISLICLIFFDLIIISASILGGSNYNEIIFLSMFASPILFYLFFKSWNHPFYNKISLVNSLKLSIPFYTYINSRGASKLPREDKGEYLQKEANLSLLFKKLYKKIIFIAVILALLAGLILFFAFTKSTLGKKPFDESARPASSFWKNRFGIYYVSGYLFESHGYFSSQVIPLVKKIKEADVSTFSLVEGQYRLAKDKNSVYFLNYNREIKKKENIDAASFECLYIHNHNDYKFCKDKNNVYRISLSDIVQMDNVDADTFQIVIPFKYYKDKNNAFSLYPDDKLHVIEGADASTFQEIGSHEKYAKDRNSVYYEGKKIPEADPLSVVVVLQDGMIVLKDKNYVYIDGKPEEQEKSMQNEADNSIENNEVIASNDCQDSDGGKNYSQKGFSISTTNNTEWYDRCNEDDSKLVESYCNGEYVNFTTYECPNGCEDGKCI